MTKREPKIDQHFKKVVDYQMREVMKEVGSGEHTCCTVNSNVLIIEIAPINSKYRSSGIFRKSARKLFIKNSNVNKDKIDRRVKPSKRRIGVPKANRFQI